MSYEVTYWQNCYDLNWKGVIVDPAFAHPAKFSHGLIKRIYQHALTTGLIEPGGVVVDPFGGVALGGIYAMQNGLHWIGCELEEKFVDLGRENIALWNDRYAAHFANRGTARLLQGDSRRLADVIGGAGLVVGSPPYADSINSEKNGIDWEKVKKDYPGRKMHEARIEMAERHHNDRRYGSAPGQLGAMKPGDLTAVICSPPFAGNSGGRGEASRNGIDSALFDRHSGGMKGGTGTNPANLDHLKMSDIGPVVGSLPYEGSGMDTNEKNGVRAGLNRQVVRKNRAENIAPGELAGSISYGSTPGQIGTESGETFWQAARQIVEQCALILPIGGAAIWVVKDFIKNGARVEFSEQWRLLCESCGFETVEIVRAMLVKDKGEQVTIAAGFDTSASTTNLLGETVETAGAALVNKQNKTERKSFFRRLHEKKRPDLAIDYEVVLFMRRVESTPIALPPTL